MEQESPAKGRRRKLKRIVQRKPKVNLNSSASVAYYKKVKAALNASLNSSRVSQTLRANNKALAQSLQHVKQELRLAFNENGRLKMENQDLLVCLRRLENETGCEEQQSSNEQRLHSIKAMLNSMSRHLLDLGTNVNDAMDLCLVTPRASTASTSRPQSLEPFQDTQEKETDAGVADLTDETVMSVDSDMKPEEVDEVFPGASGADGAAKVKALPDMSIILEQSMVDVEDKRLPPDILMDTVLEELQSSSKTGVKKLSTHSKLPQRVLTRVSGKSSSSSDEEGDSSEVEEKTTTTCKKRAGAKRVESKKLTHPADTNTACLSSLPKSPSNHRRETFVVSKDLKLSNMGNVEEIASIKMVDLVSGSPLKDEEMPEVLDVSDQTPAQDGVGETTAVSPGKENKSKQKTSTVKAKVTVSSKGRRKSGGKKSESVAVKSTKGAGAKQPLVSQKDSEFFISNPCALNLVHKKVTGSAEGCLEPKAENKPKSVSTVDLFVAEIKESNRKSSKVASFISLEEPSSGKKSRSSAEKSSDFEKPRRSMDAALASELAKPNQTMYFDTDMDFTEVLPETHNLESLSQQRDGSGEVPREKELKTRTRPESQKKEDTEKDTRKPTSTRSRSKATSAGPEEANPGGEETENDIPGPGDDKKLAVALRVSKPGQMIFAASRKEDDGSRKAIPAKLQTKARSKSKKQMEEMMKNLPEKEPESIFDFHDKTPRHTITDGQTARQQSSVFDLSLSDNVPATIPSLAVTNKEKRLENLESAAAVEQSEKKRKPKKSKDDSVSSVRSVVPSLLGDAPVYTLPLKDDTSDPSQPDSQVRGQSDPSSRQSGRQSRSRSRSRKGDETEKQEKANPGNLSRRGRSRSRTKSENDRTNDEMDGERSEKVGLNEKSKEIKSEKEIAGQDKDSSERPRRSARSRSRVRKTYGEDVEENALNASWEAEGKGEEAGLGRSRSKPRDEDEEYKPSKQVEKTQQRGRSRQKKNVCAEENKSRDFEETEEQQQQRRGRSRSRRRVEEKISSKTEDKPNESSKQITETNTLEGKPENFVNNKESLPAVSNNAPDKAADNNQDSSAAESDSGTEPVRMVTERRQRSKSRRLYNVTDDISDPFGFSADLVEANPDSQKASIPDHGPDGEKIKRRTKSRGTLLQQHSDKASGDPRTSPRAGSHAHQEGLTEKRKSSSESDCAISGEREGSPCKKLRSDRKDKTDTQEGQSADKQKSNLEADAVSGGSELKADGETGPTAGSPVVKKKRKSSLPIAVKHGEEKEKAQQTPTPSAKVKSEKSSKIPKSAEKNEYQQKFEEIKRKLKKLDPADAVCDLDCRSQPVKKSRPLVLPTTSSTVSVASTKTCPSRSLLSHDKDLSKSKPVVRSKKCKSQPASPADAKESQPQLGSPGSRPQPSTTAVSPAFSADGATEHHSKDTEESEQADGRRVRRAASSVCYKEPSLNAKLRRGDPHTTFLHKEETRNIFKSPKGPRKHGKLGRLERGVLHDLTNLSIDEAEAE